MRGLKTYADSRLLIVTYTRDDAIQAASMAKLSSQHKPLILAADFASSIHLRELNLSYVVPAHYLDRRKCDSIDERAVALARNWYKSVESRLTYHRISIGEMKTYDFVHVFIDAFRSIEIAKKILSSENLSELMIPETVPKGPANASRYQALPRALAYIADSYGVMTSRYGSPLPGRRKHRLKQVSARVIAWASEERGRIRLITKQRHMESTTLIVFLDTPAKISAAIREYLEINETVSVLSIAAQDLAKQAWTRINRRQIQGALEKDLFYDGIPLVKILPERFSEFFEDFPKLVGYIRGTEQFIEDTAPDIVIVMEDISPVLRTITKVCRLNRVPTLVIQHGITCADLGGIHVMPVEADKQAVWGNTSKDWSLRRGKAPETQVVTGNPGYDMVVLSRFHRKELYEKLNLCRSKSFIVIATSWYQPVSSCYTPDEDATFIREALEAAKEFPEKQVVVKLHSAYSAEYRDVVLAAAQDAHIDVVITTQFLWELLSACDLLITQTSTVALEAMILDKPVITFATPGTRKFNPYACSGASIDVDSTEALVDAIRESLYIQEVRDRLRINRARFIHDYAYIQDGKAAQRVAMLVLDMAGPRRARHC